MKWKKSMENLSYNLKGSREPIKNDMNEIAQRNEELERLANEAKTEIKEINTRLDKIKSRCRW